MKGHGILGQLFISFIVWQPNGYLSLLLTSAFMLIILFFLLWVIYAYLFVIRSLGAFLISPSPICSLGIARGPACGTGVPGHELGVVAVGVI